MQNNHLGYTINLGKDGYIKTNQIYTQNPIFELDWIENQRKNAVKTNINEKVEYNLTSYTFKELIEKKNEKFSFNSDINLDLNPYNIYMKSLYSNGNNIDYSSKLDQMYYEKYYEKQKYSLSLKNLNDLDLLKDNLDKSFKKDFIKYLNGEKSYEFFSISMEHIY